MDGFHKAAVSVVSIIVVGIFLVVAMAQHRYIVEDAINACQEIKAQP